MVQILAPPRDAKEMLESIPEVLNVQVTGIHGGATEFKVEPQENAEITRAIAERAIAKRWPITEMYTKELTLEDIYIRMVNEDPEKLDIHHAPVQETAEPETETKEENE
jgi:hypothetical protein